MDLEKLLLEALQPRRAEKMLEKLDKRLGWVRLVVENLHHPHNMSAVMRTAEAMGVQYVHAVETRENFVFSKRITRGSHKWLTLKRHDTFAECVAELKSEGFRIYAAMLSDDSIPLDDIPIDTPVALVFGNEAEGVDPETEALCDGTYTIPMEGFVQSLNISVAAAISLYGLTRRVRKEAPDSGLLSEEARATVLKSWLPKSVSCGRRLMHVLGRDVPR